MVGLFIFSCNPTTEKKASDAKAEFKAETPVEKSNTESTEFQFLDFKIMNGRLGSIEVGMTIQEAEKQFDGLTKKEDEAVNFGFGGGSPAYLYYSGAELLFGLIPSLGTDTLLFIIAAHKNLQTTNGLTPNSTVKELLEKYPDLIVNQDLMNSWEYFQDTVNNWDFIFMTDAQTAIGEYPDLESPSKPKRLTTKTDWITIQ